MTTFAEAFEAWRKSQTAMDALDRASAEHEQWDAVFADERAAIWDLIEARGSSLAEVRQRAEVLVAECKSGPAADGRLVALALSLVRDLNVLKG